jgi:hypothetical protein
MKKIIIILFLGISVNISSQQLLTFGDTNRGSFGESLFIDASAFITAGPNAAKGLGFPRTDLTSFNFLTQEGDGFTEFLTGYDGTIVYNTGNGTTPTSGSGVGSQEVEPGFYYFKNLNSSGSSSTGMWVRLGSEGSPKIHVTENTPTETNLVTVDTTVEKVISITGTADGITTHMDLGTTVLPKDTVVNFRKAIICDSTGNQVLVATGSYDSATNKFVTGNGMMNYCLPAANDYKVELYFTSN